MCVVKMKSEWNRETLKQLAKQLGVRVQEVVASHTSNDPFYQVSESQRKLAEWFKVLFEKAKVEAPQVLGVQFSKLHLRRLHYYLDAIHHKRVDGTLYVNDQASWAYLTRASKIARYMGFISYKDVTDRRNPEARTYINYSSHVEFSEFRRYSDEAPSRFPFRFDRQGKTSKLEWVLGYPFFNDADQLAERLGEIISEEHVNYNQQLLQPYHLEVWCEKSTMNDVLVPICRRFHANFVYGLGEESITRVDELVDRILEAEKPVRIFYISDHDDAGICMPVSVARKIQFFNVNYHNNSLDIKLQHLVLTKEQIEHFKLPKAPVKKGRLSTRTELDALESLHPGELAKILTNALSPFVDITLQGRISRAIEGFRDEISSDVYGAVMENDDEINKLIEEFNEHYKEVNETIEELREKVADINKKTAPINEKIIKLQNEHLDLSDLSFELPTAEVEEEPEQEWLYDNNLDYLEQTKRLKKQKEG